MGKGVEKAKPPDFSMGSGKNAGKKEEL